MVSLEKVMPTSEFPPIDPHWAYVIVPLAALVLSGGSSADQIVYMHQQGSCWTEEVGSALTVLTRDEAQAELADCFDRGIPIVALEKEDMLRRLSALPSVMHPFHAN